MNVRSAANERLLQMRAGAENMRHAAAQAGSLAASDCSRQYFVHTDFGEPFGSLMPGARGAVLAAVLRTGAPLSGRRIHSLVASHSLGAVQQALRDLEQVGVITTETVGRTGVHRVNESHETLAPLRALASPIAMLTRVVGETAPEAETVVVFGSIARGEAHATSDIDLLVIAPATWEGRSRLQQQVRERTGNDCDVLHLTAEEFTRAPGQREPVVAEIVRDGLTIVGTMPRSSRTKAS